METFDQYIKRKKKENQTNKSFDSYVKNKTGVSLDELAPIKKVAPSVQRISAPMRTSAKSDGKMGYEDVMSLEPKIQNMLLNFVSNSNKVGVYKAENDIINATGWDDHTLYSYLEVADKMVNNGVSIPSENALENNWKPAFTTGKDASAKVEITEEGQKNSYLQLGALEDGVTLENAWKGARATEVDVVEDATKGILGGLEKVWDFFYMLATNMAKSNEMQVANDKMIYSVISGDKEMGETALSTALKNQEMIENAATEYVAEDLIKEEEIAHNLIIAPFEERTGINVEENSYLGAKSDALVQSASEMLVKIGADAIAPGSGVVLTIASAGGGEMENALRNGATYEEAVLSGIITGGVEAATEQIGGIKFGGKSVSKAVADGIAKNITKKGLAIFTKWGIDVATEGSEEVLSYIFSSLGQWLTHRSEEEIWEIINKEELFENLIAGSIMGGLFGGGSAINAAVNKNAKTDYVTGKDKNEQKVFDNLYQEAIKNAEAEKGDTLTRKEKSDLYDEVERAIEKGEIDIEIIEKVLGGDNYKSYQEAIANEEALRQEYEKLGNVSNPTLAQTARYNELSQQIKELDKSSRKSELKNKLEQGVYDLVKDTKLAESYNEKARKGQAFEADLSKYDEKQRAVIQKAVESGILNNTNKTHDFVNLIAKISADKGISFDFTNNERLKASGFAIDGKIVNGFENGGNITLNINSAKSLNVVVGHEVTHVLKGTDFYSDLQNAVFEYANMKGEYDTRLADITELYKGVKDADINEELTADLVGDYLFTDEKFVQQLFRQNRNAFQRVWNEIKYFCKIATAGSQEAKKLLEVQKIFEKVWNEGKVKSDVSNDIKYSLNANAANELHKVLQDIKYREEVLLRDATPEIMSTQKGVKNLPMVMKASHIRENVFTEDEAKQLGLKVDKYTNYHGLGEELFLKVIDSLDDVDLAYRGTKNASNTSRRENYFLLISKITDENGQTINVPVYINEHAQYNRVFIDVNKIATVFARDEFQEYINRQLRNNELIRIKKRSIKTSERDTPIVPGYRSDASNNSISQNTEKAIQNSRKSLSNNSQDIAPIGKWNVKGSDIGPVRKDIGVPTSNLPDDYAPIAEEYLNKPAKMWNPSIKNLAKQGKFGIMWLTEYEKLLRKGDVVARDDISSLLDEDDSSVIDNVITDGSHLVDGKLKPNVTYKTGEHGYLYKTNENGLIVKATAICLQLKIHKGRLKHNRNTYGKKAGDHAGHLFGDRFGGSPELDNLVSQAQRVNLKEYKVIENEWVKALKNGKKVSVDINVNYDVESTRPTSFHISYNIDGVRHFKQIFN